MKTAAVSLKLRKSSLQKKSQLLLFGFDSPSF